MDKQKVSFIGDLTSPEIFVEGLGTIGRWNPTKSAIEIYRRKNSSSVAGYFPDEIQCKTKGYALEKIRYWLTLISKSTIKVEKPDTE